MEIKDALKKRRGKIFVLLVRDPGLTITEISEKINLPQPHVTTYIKELAKNKFVRVEFDDKGRGIKKRCYPTFRRFYEDLALQLRKKLTEEDYKIIDDLMLDPEFNKIVLGKDLPKNIDPFTLFTLSMGSSVPILKEKLEKNERLREKAERYFEVNKKLFG